METSFFARSLVVNNSAYILYLVSVSEGYSKFTGIDIFMLGRSSHGKSLSAERKADAFAAYIKTHGLASIQVKLSALFTGVKSINNRLGCRVGTVEDLLIKLTVDTPLLSEPQRKILNPMVIRVSSACNMPSKPLSYRELQDK